MWWNGCLEILILIHFPLLPILRPQTPRRVRTNTLRRLDIHSDQNEYAHTKPSRQNTQTPSSEIRKNLLGYWSLEDGKGTVAQDLSGRNNHGTLKNGPSWNPSGADKGLSFDGNNDYVDLGNLNVSGDRITLSAWIKADRFNHLSMEDGRIISKARGVSESDHYWMLSTCYQSGPTPPCKTRVQPPP